MAVATVASIVKARVDSKRRGVNLLDEVPHFTEDARRDR
jgi:tellurite resistance protein TerC